MTGNTGNIVNLVASGRRERPAAAGARADHATAADRPAPARAETPGLETSL